MFHDRTADVAKGKWRGILMSLGVPEACLKDKHGPCPLCSGKDRFRWDNKDGKGTYICGQCGAGDGMKLAMEYTGRAFRDVAREIDAMVGNIKPEASRPAITPEQSRDRLRDAYRGTQPIQPGDAAHAYLARRGVEELIYPDALRFHPSMRDGEGGVRPAMVAMIGVHGEDRFCSMHRTFLAPDGAGKAEMAAPRKIMPGELPPGACVMLSDYHGGPLGIAEGIETAMSASALYSMPVWAAINSTLLAKWTPPEGCDEVVVFGDNDAKFGGQAAAYALAHALAARKGIAASVVLPPEAGKDFNDMWLEYRRAQA